MPNSVSNIDFSQVDLIAGVVIGAAATAVVGFIFWRAKVVKFLWERNDLEPSTLSELKDMIRSIQTDMKEYVRDHQECQRHLPEKYVSWDVLNNRILDKLDKDRERRWNEYDRHRHDPVSGILIKL